MKILKRLLSLFCLVLVATGTGICLYELYNSFISTEPKNVITYHLATSSVADEVQTTLDIVPSDGFNNSRFSTSDTIEYNTTEAAIEVDTINSVSDFMYFAYIGTQTEVSSVCALISSDDKSFYFITDSLWINDENSIYIGIDEDTLINATLYIKDEYTDIAILSIKKSLLSLTTARDMSASLKNRLDDSAMHKPGSPVVYISLSDDNSYVFNYGIISKLQTVGNDTSVKESSSIELIFTDFSISTSSPGFLVDMSGNIIGLNTNILNTLNVTDNNLSVLSLLSLPEYLSLRYEDRIIYQKEDYEESTNAFSLIPDTFGIIYDNIKDMFYD